MNLKPGQCDIKNVSITDHTKSIVINKEFPQAKILEFLDTIDIYESIFTPHITADISLIDGANLREKYNISGDEDFEIEFVGYGNDQPLKYKLKIVELLGLIPNSNLRSKAYTLRAASQELLIESATTIAKSYASGTKEIVDDVVKNFLKSSKPLFIEETKDLPVTVIPYMTPFQAIDFIRQRAVSQKYKSSSFVFFETGEGFFFTTIEGLLERGAAASPQKFFQREGISQNVKGSGITDFDSFRLFSNYTVKSPFNLNRFFNDGALQSNIAEYDITRKAYRRRQFLNSPSNKNFFTFSTSTNPDITQEIFDKYSIYANKPYLIPFALYKDTENKTDNFLYDSIPERLCFANILTQERTYIDIPGNTKIHAGSIIELDVPKYEATQSKKVQNKMDSGLYLVATVRHTIKNADTAKYDTHLELVRFGRGVFEQ